MDVFVLNYAPKEPIKKEIKSESDFEELKEEIKNGLNLKHCNIIFKWKQITDSGLEYLKGVHTIYLLNCNKITDK